MKKGLKKPMNKQDKQDLELILYRLNEQDKSVQKLEKHFTSKFNEIQEDISFIKENLFNPNEGLWAETQQNTQFRENTTMWRTIIGGGLIALIGDMFWDMFSK